MLKILLWSLFLYLGLLLALYLFQRQVIYLPDRHRPQPQDWRVADMQVVTLATQDGLKLNAWYKAAQPGQVTIVYVHGNAGHIGFRGPGVRHFLDAGLGVLLVEYRGYGGNPGAPTEQGLYHDGRAALQFLQQQPVSAACTVFYGESIGSGVAIQLATEQKVGAVVLQAPMTSLNALAKLHYRLFYNPWVLKDKFANLEKIAAINAPLFIVHGALDNIVPASEGQKLFAAAKQPKVMKVYPRAGHNDIFTVELAGDVVQFVRKHVSCGVLESNT